MLGKAPLKPQQIHFMCLLNRKCSANYIKPKPKGIALDLIFLNWMLLHYVSNVSNGLFFVSFGTLPFHSHNRWTKTHDVNIQMKSIQRYSCVVLFVFQYFIMKFGIFLDFLALLGVKNWVKNQNLLVNLYWESNSYIAITTGIFAILIAMLNILALVIVWSILLSMNILVLYERCTWVSSPWKAYLLVCNVLLSSSCRCALLFHTEHMSCTSLRLNW